jgi:hypothetical protein
MIWSIVFVGAIISIKNCVIKLCNELYQKKNLVHVLDFNDGESKCAINFEDAFYNNMFQKDLLKYKDPLYVIFLCCSIETTNVNIVSSHIFKHMLLILWLFLP